MVSLLIMVHWKHQYDEENLLFFLARQLLLVAGHGANKQAEIWRTPSHLEIHRAAYLQPLAGRRRSDQHGH
jgi:hypothetical protein